MLRFDTICYSCWVDERKRDCIGSTSIRCKGMENWQPALDYFSSMIIIDFVSFLVSVFLELKRMSASLLVQRLVLHHGQQRKSKRYSRKWSTSIHIVHIHSLSRTSRYAHRFIQIRHQIIIIWKQQWEIQLVQRICSRGTTDRHHIQSAIIYYRFEHQQNQSHHLRHCWTTNRMSL